MFEAAWFEELDAILKEDAEYALVSRYFDERVGFLIDDREVSALFVDGGVRDVVEQPRLQAGWRFGFQASASTWTAFMQPEPPPMYQDVFALISRVPDFSLLGDRLRFMQHARAIQLAMRSFWKVTQ